MFILKGLWPCLAVIDPHTSHADTLAPANGIILSGMALPERQLWVLSQPSFTLNLSGRTSSEPRQALCSAARQRQRWAAKDGTNQQPDDAPVTANDCSPARAEFLAVHRYCDDDLSDHPAGIR
eukprot:146001-Rhodomonas_salina.2